MEVWRIIPDRLSVGPLVPDLHSLKSSWWKWMARSLGYLHLQKTKQAVFTPRTCPQTLHPWDWNIYSQSTLIKTNVDVHNACFKKERPRI